MTVIICLFLVSPNRRVWFCRVGEWGIWPNPAPFNPPMCIHKLDVQSLFVFVIITRLLVKRRSKVLFSRLSVRVSVCVSVCVCVCGRAVVEKLLIGNWCNLVGTRNSSGDEMPERDQISSPCVNPRRRYPLQKFCGQIKKQTVNDISSACLSAYGDNKQSNL